MKAILLAGGKGTRLRPLTLHTPKPIVPIFNRPFLHYQLDLLRQVPEITEVILSLNYQPRRIEEVFGNGDRARHPDSLPGRAVAARHRRRDQVRRAAPRRPGHRLQRRRADADRPQRRDRAASRAQGQGDDRADAGRQPLGVRPGRDRRRRQASGASSRSRSPTRSPATRSTPASTCSSPTRSIASRRTRPTRSSAATFPSLVERGETFVAYVYAATGSTSARRSKYVQVHRDIMDGTFQAAPFAGATAGVRLTDGARIEEGVQITGPCFIDEGAVIKAGAAHRPLRGDRPPVHSRRRRDRRAARSSGPTRWIGRDAAGRRDAIVGRNCHVGRNVVGPAGPHARRQVGAHRFQPGLRRSGCGLPTLRASPRSPGPCSATGA